MLFSTYLIVVFTSSATAKQSCCVNLLLGANREIMISTVSPSNKARMAQLMEIYANSFEALFFSISNDDATIKSERRRHKFELPKTSLRERFQLSAEGERKQKENFAFIIISMEDFH